MMQTVLLALLVVSAIYADDDFDDFESSESSTAEPMESTLKLEFASPDASFDDDDDLSVNDIDNDFTSTMFMDESDTG